MNIKAWNVLKPGSLDHFRFQEKSLNGLSENTVRIEVKAIGINPADFMQVMGTHQNPPPLPFSPGFEIAGIVSESNASNHQKGDRVMASMDFGAYQEYVDVPKQLVEAIPDAVSFTTAAAIPIAYGTAYVSVIVRGGLKSGETLVVFGATGGVGSRIVEIGAARGANVVAIFSKEKEKEFLKSLGAQALVNYKNEDLTARIEEITQGKGANVIADLVGGDMFQVALKNIAWEGRILPIGAASGKIPQLNSIDMLIRNASLVGTDFAAYISKEPKAVRQTFKKLFKWHKKGKLNFPEPANVFPFEEADNVLQQIGKSSLKGKTVLTMS